MLRTTILLLVTATAGVLGLVFLVKQCSTDSSKPVPTKTVKVGITDSKYEECEAGTFEVGTFVHIQFETPVTVRCICGEETVLTKEHITRGEDVPFPCCPEHFLIRWKSEY
jgi:hypothetical protein